MNYISAEEFLRQPEKVQKAFRKWFKDNIKPYDLYMTVDKWSEVICLSNKQDCIQAVKDCINTTIPLFTEGQLRRFIEDKTKFLIKIDTMPCNYYVTANCKHSNGGHDLLHEYWQVACQIAEEGLHD